MLSVDEARARILQAVAPMPVVRVPVRAARGLVLAAPVVAAAPLPPFANSAMDGFAVRADDTALASLDRPVRLAIGGLASAGHVSAAEVKPGTAVRIMTGAPVPVGADAIVRFEETDEIDRSPDTPATEVHVRRAVVPGENVRPAGEDVVAGATVLTAGIEIGPATIGLLAALGEQNVAVHRRPRVAILVTGDEVVPAGTPLGPGQIHDSNGPMLAAFVESCGGEAISLGVTNDERDAIHLALRSLDHHKPDLLLTTGGVSAGDYDLVKDVLRESGQIDLWQVRIKPGKPLAFGWIEERPLIGLPGNPVAAAVAFLQFARPAILRMLGRTDLELPTIPARLRAPIDNRGSRRHFVRVRLVADADGWSAHPAGSPGAGILSSLVRADGLLVIPETTTIAEPGDLFQVQAFDWRRFTL